MSYRSIRVILKQWSHVYFYLHMGELFLPHVLGMVLSEYGIEIPKVNYRGKHFPTYEQENTRAAYTDVHSRLDIFCLF